MVRSEQISPADGGVRAVVVEAYFGHELSALLRLPSGRPSVPAGSGSVVAPGDGVQIRVTGVARVFPRSS